MRPRKLRQENLTQGQFAALAKLTKEEVRTMKQAGELDSILSDAGLIQQGRARAWVMRRAKRDAQVSA